MILIILKLLFFPVVSPLFVGMIRKVKAYMQNRQGASIAQPYADLWKLFHKDEIIAKDASWVFLVTPYILFALSILLPLGIPLLASQELLGTFGDMLVVIYTIALMTFFLALAGLDTGSAFGGFGSSREMTLAALTEAVLLFALIPVSFVAHTTNMVAMTTIVAGLPIIGYVPVILAFLGYFIALMSETGRIPFDNAATHLELTMIHEAMILEYSGKRLALIEWANANKFVFFIFLGMTVFFPWGLDTSHCTVLSGCFDPAMVAAFFITMIKSILLVVVIGIIESSMAKFRLFRLPDLLLTGFIFGVIAIIMALV